MVVELVVKVVVVVVEDVVLDGGADVGSSRQHAKTPRCQAHRAGLLPTTMAGYFAAINSVR